MSVIRIFSKSFYSYIFIILLFFGCSSNQLLHKDTIKYPVYTNYDTVKAKRFDTGKMWTFEHAPLDYFEETYNFVPSEDWLTDVRLSSLKFARWCTASFVSEDGLIMTNHHCVDFIIRRFEEEGEDLKKTGFYAPTLADERKIKDIYVDQLAFIEDVTDEVVSAFNSGRTDAEKESNKAKKIEELEKSYSDETGLRCAITELYNGGKYSLYGYKRYNDIRAVYVNETDMGLWGGDPDNFTYPRYNADFAFVRAYDENGKPVKTNNFYKFSLSGPQAGEPLFVVGNPGSTSRLQTVAQLEYARDFQYRAAAFSLEKYIDLFYELLEEHPERADEFNETIVSAGNGAKVYGNTFRALVDPYIIARKKDFERKFREAVNADPKLKSEYGELWNNIEMTCTELRNIAPERYAYRISRSTTKYFDVAKSLIELSRQLQLPDEQRKPDFKKEMLDSTIANIYPADFDHVVNTKLIELHAAYITELLGVNNPVVYNFTNGFTGDEVVEYVKSKSRIMNAEDTMELIKKGSEAILASGDPFINFLLSTQDKLAELDKQANEIAATQDVMEEIMGQALYAVYGTSIPPDASFTLRINDGVMKEFEYNGTIAPTFTTFYGMYDRFKSFKEKYPWNLPERWQNPKEGFDMSTPFNFVSTNDITGGSSGSAVINSNAELVGIAFDGNIESITGNIIYLPEINRMVSVASPAILQILRYVAGADRIADELKAGKIVNMSETVNTPDIKE
ncbi:MAG: S46 family peptidase [Melioribacteraceae bacterium]|nr:S46 family peptidase [Melioribacteraceae bacterium]